MDDLFLRLGFPPSRGAGAAPRPPRPPAARLPARRPDRPGARALRQARRAAHQPPHLRRRHPADGDLRQRGHLRQRGERRRGPAPFRADPGRIAAQIVSGIGFLGAGTILQSRGTSSGLTTAATIWVVAAIGMAVGAHAYVEAIGSTVLVCLSLVLPRPRGGPAHPPAPRAALRLHPRPRPRAAQRRAGDLPQAGAAGGDGVGGARGEQFEASWRSPGPARLHPRAQRSLVATRHPPHDPGALRRACAAWCCNLDDAPPRLGAPRRGRDEIRAALPAGWEVVEVTAAADGRGDGGGPRPEALARRARRGGLPGLRLSPARSSPPPARAAARGCAGCTRPPRASAARSTRRCATRGWCSPTRPGSTRPPIAETVLGMLLYFARGFDLAVRGAGGAAAGRSRPSRPPTPRCASSPAATLGLLGFGGIGREVARPRPRRSGCGCSPSSARPPPPPPGVEVLAGEDGLRRAPARAATTSCSPSPRPTPPAG